MLNRCNARWKAAKPCSGAAAGANCGTRARPPATCRKSVKSAWTVTLIPFSSLSIRLDPPATQVKRPVFTAPWRKPMPDILDELQAIIADRKRNPKDGSYTNRLFEEGSSRIAQKAGEEAVEVVVAALTQGREEQIGEFCDLFYHTLVLMTQLHISLYDVFSELERRHNKS